MVIGGDRDEVMRYPVLLRKVGRAGRISLIDTDFGRSGPGRRVALRIAGGALGLRSGHKPLPNVYGCWTCLSRPAAPGPPRSTSGVQHDVAKRPVVGEPQFIDGMDDSALGEFQMREEDVAVEDQQAVRLDRPLGLLIPALHLIENGPHRCESSRSTLWEGLDAAPESFSWSRGGGLTLVR